MATMMSERAGRRVLRTDHPPGGLGLDWIMTVLAGLAWAGVYADGRSHRLFGPDQAVISAYHVTFFSAAAVAGLFLAGLALLNLRDGYAWTRALPRAYIPSFLALAGFGVAGVVDQGGHWLFGFEVGLEALLSPTHIILFAMGVIIAAGPVRAAAARAAADTLRERLPLLLSAAVTLAAMSFALTIFLPLSGRLWMTSELRTPVPLYAELLGIGGTLLQSALMMGVLLYLVREYRLPRGSLTIVLGTFGLISAIQPIPLLLLAVWLLTGAGADLLYVWLRPSAGRRGAFVLFGGLVPLLLWGVTFALIGLSGLGGGLWWSGYILSGTLVYAGAVGALMALLATPAGRSAGPGGGR